jgi:hypothetical protein
MATLVQNTAISKKEAYLAELRAEIAEAEAEIAAGKVISFDSPEAFIEQLKKDVERRLKCEE